MVPALKIQNSLFGGRLDTTELRVNLNPVQTTINQYGTFRHDAAELIGYRLHLTTSIAVLAMECDPSSFTYILMLHFP